MKVGAHTRMEQQTRSQEKVRRLLAALPQEQRDRMWTINTQAGAWGGTAPDGQSTEVRRFLTFGEARMAASFQLRVPATLPAQFVLRDVLVAPGGSGVFGVYVGPDAREIVIAQTDVRGTPAEVGAFTGTVTSIGVGVVSDEPVMPLDIAGTPAAWNKGMLVWEKGGISFAIAGRGLALDEAERIHAGMS